MGDFAQSGLICTLQRLNAAHAGHLEAELPALAQNHPIGLILPCHAADLESAALWRIREELSCATWIGEIVLSLNGVCERQATQACAFFQTLPARLSVLWNDSPSALAALQRLRGEGAPRTAAGKGINVWAGIGVLTGRGAAQSIVLQDCDVASFERQALARLCYASAHPELQFAAAKMYYSRDTDRLHGRVSRLFLQPLLDALLHVIGHHPLLDFLLSFRYPLAGEMALHSHLASALPLEPGWGLEIGALCEIFRRADPRTVCQVDGGSGYEHKHQPAEEALSAMCVAIGQTLLAQLARECSLEDSVSSALGAAFTYGSLDARRRYAALARINGMQFDAAEEERLARLFASVLPRLSAPGASPLPPWDLIRRERPAAGDAFLEAALYSS